MSKCKHLRSRVIRTNVVPEQDIRGNEYDMVKRTRECSLCHTRWETYEILSNEYEALTRVKERARQQLYGIFK